MARPRKCRRVCLLPKCTKFIPNNWDNANTITLFIDEAEAIRLIDKEGLMQEEAAQMMGVARTTVQQIYQEARYKIASALIDGKALIIEGGDVEVCSSMCCGKSNCYQMKELRQIEKQNLIAIPVSSDKQKVYNHFAQAPLFALYDLNNKTYSFVDNEWDSGIKVARALCEKGICGVIAIEIGEKVKSYFSQIGIEIKITNNIDFDFLIKTIGD